MHHVGIPVSNRWTLTVNARKGLLLSDDTINSLVTDFIRTRNGIALHLLSTDQVRSLVKRNDAHDVYRIIFFCLAPEDAKRITTFCRKNEIRRLVFIALKSSITHVEFTKDRPDDALISSSNEYGFDMPSSVEYDVETLEHLANTDAPSVEGRGTTFTDVMRHIMGTCVGGVF